MVTQLFLEDSLRYLHLADINNLAASDMLTKVRPFYEMMNQRFLKSFQLEENLCVEETMIPFYRKLSAKHYVKGKPIKFGHNLWCLNSRLGYLAQCINHTLGNTVSALGLGGSVVTKLMKLLPENLSFLVTFDNFFTSLNLLLYLGSKGIGATGTLRANRIVKFPIMVQKEMAKKHRGTMDHCYDSAKKIVVTRWNDNCVVTLASNCQVVNLVGKTKRYSRKKRKIIEVDKPYVVRYFNQNMCGVDRMDQNISFYRIPVHVRNGFRREVVDICRRKHLSRQRGVDSVGRQILVAPRKLVKVPEPIRFDGQGNYSASNLAQRRCLYCGMKVKLIYEK